MRDSKQFAIDNAGKRFKFGRRIVTVVGYREKGIAVGGYVIVSHRIFGWRALPESDSLGVLLTETKNKHFWYVFPEELKPL